MKKTMLALIAVLVLTANIAVADILPEGQKTVPVCSFFNNTVDFLDEFVVLVQEETVSGDKLPVERILGDECFTKGYKFNTLNVYGLSIEYFNLIEDLENYDPSEDENAYPTNLPIHAGVEYLDEDSLVVEHKYEYEILEIDEELENLMIELVEMHEILEATEEGAEEETEEETEEESEEETEEETEDFFLDVDAENTYFDALTYLKNAGVVQGYSDGTYKPNNSINRAEFTKIIVETIATDEEIEGCAGRMEADENGVIALFTDVKFDTENEETSVWFFDYICIAKEQNLINGHPDGSFKPADEINFVEASKIIVLAHAEEVVEEEAVEEEVVEEEAVEEEAVEEEVVEEEVVEEEVVEEEVVEEEVVEEEAVEEEVVEEEVVEEEVVEEEAVEEVIAESPWYKSYVEVLAEKFAIPTTVDTFSKQITRGEMAEMIYRLDNGIVDKDSLTYEEIK
jgi:hypothetical protein